MGRRLDQLPRPILLSFHFEGARAAIAGCGFYKILSPAGSMDELKLAVQDPALLFNRSVKWIDAIHTEVVDWCERSCKGEAKGRAGK